MWRRLGRGRGERAGLGLAQRILYDSTYTVQCYDVYAVLKKSPYLTYKLVLNGYTIYTIFARAGPFHVDLSFP
jgi:hypothetical protein